MRISFEIAPGICGWNSPRSLAEDPQAIPARNISGITEGLLRVITAEIPFAEE